MALKPTAKPEFEPLDDDEQHNTQTAAQRLQAEADSRATANKAAEPEPDVKPASKERGIAAASSNQVAVAKPMTDPFTPLKNAFPVEFDTLCNVQLNQGNAINKDTGAALGDVIGLELLSFQDQTVVSPGVDGEEAKEHVRYSDDGVTTSQGESVPEYLAHLKSAGYPDAKLSQRVIIVGSLFDPGVKGKKIAGMKDKLVQINLPPSSVGGFKRYRADQAFQIGKGLAKLEDVEKMRITCNIKTKGDNTWTVAEFTRYDTPVE